jgi:hypothetical protein
MAKDDLTKTVADFRDKYFRFFPKKATELGNHDYDDSLGKWNREGVRERITFLQHYRDLIKDSLEIDALIIKNILDSNLFHLKVIRPHTRPDFYAGYALDSIDRLIHLLQKTHDTDALEGVVDSLVSRVNGFPILFEQSKEWLKVTTPVSRNLALFLVEFFQEFLETDYRRFIATLDLPRAFNEKLIGAIPFTKESLSRFAHFVRTLEVIPQDHPSLRQSKDFFKHLFQQKYMLKYNAKELLEMSRERINTLTAEMEKISGKDIDGFYENLVERNLFDSHGINDTLMSYCLEKADEYFDFCTRTHLIPTERKPSIEWTPIYRRRTSPLASYIPKGPYETLRQQGVLWICPAEEPLSRERFLERKYLYHRQMINSLLIHELIGHHLQFDRIPTIDREAFKISSNLTSDEGFALYVEETFTREYAKTLESPQEADDMLFFQKKAELMRAHRVYVDVNLSTGRLSLEEAVRYFADQNTMPFETAKAECEKYFLNPGTASSYLVGKMELMGLRERLRKKFQDAFSLPLFHQGLVNYGAIPIPLIQRSMIEKLFRVEQVI